ncbi:MAG: hypothetical protein J0L92_11250, partial [Deltaproteobacteria bacterium]|nr:hypothetical protein [Deltaproteobacteria bacterium]
STPTLLSPLAGGAAGGNGSGSTANRGVGGRGGGAIQISTRGQLTLNGSILVTGGGGGPGLRGDGTSGSGAGGGAGGAVLLEGVVVTYGASAQLDVRGGGGGAGACYDGSDDPSDDGRQGQDGYLAAPSARPAGGVACGSSGIGVYTAGPGGQGAGDSALNGQAGTDADNAGGGGGGAGCVATRSTNRAAPVSLPNLTTVRATDAPIAD